MDDSGSKAPELKHPTPGDLPAATAVERKALAANRFTRASLYSFLAFLAGTALLAIASVLSGRFGDFEIKVLISTSVITVASICLLCCSAHAARSKTPLPGLGGSLLAGLSAAMLIWGVWSEKDSEDYWKPTAVLSVFAIACAHILALLSVRLRMVYVWTQFLSVAAILTLAIVISGMIVYEEDGKRMFRIVAVLTILVALGTLGIPILGRLSKGHLGPSPRTLVLTEMQDGRYHDAGGRIYEVHSVPNQQVDGTSP